MSEEQSRGHHIFLLTRPSASSSGTSSVTHSAGVSLHHWGLLVTEYSEEDLGGIRNARSDQSWGTYFEVTVDERQRLDDRVVKNFVPSHQVTWERRYIDFEGKTDEYSRRKYLELLLRIESYEIGCLNTQINHML